MRVRASFLCGVLLLAASTTAEDEARPPRMSVGGENERQQELDRLHEKLRRISNDAQAVRESQEQRLQELRAERKALSRTVEFLRAEIEKRKKALSEKREEFAKQKREQERLEDERGAHRAPLLEHLKTLEAAVESGIPWHKRQRAQEIEDTRRLIERKETPPSAALAAVARLQKEQEALGRLVETGTFEVHHEGKKVAVQAFHLGLLAVIFASESGDILGYCGPGQQLEDGIQRVRQTPEAGDGYMKAVEILRRKRTPALVNLHLASLPTAEGGEDR